MTTDQGDLPERPIPSEQYERVLEELRKVAASIDREAVHYEGSRRVEAYEVRRCFALAAVRLQEAGYWFGEGVRHAEELAAEQRSRRNA